jgi:hypothetical protein
MNTKFIDELSTRVYDDISVIIISDFEHFGIPISSESIIVSHIKHNLGRYVTPEEHEQYLIENLGSLKIDDACTLLTKLAIHMAALEVIIRLKKRLLDN